MKKSKKIKIIIALCYGALLSSFLYFFFSKFSFEELTSYEFIRNNREYFFNLKENNLFFLSFVFFIGTILWVFLAGFGSPIALLGGFIFGKWLGMLIVISGLSFGSSLLFLFSRYFLQEYVRKNFLGKFRNLESHFKKSEFNYLLLYRFVGGIPFALSNILPCIFNVKLKNFFWATYIGLIPQIFLVVSIGSGLQKAIDQNTEPPKIKELLMTPDIYMPIIGFLMMIIITFFLNRKYSLK
jgi:uncharacterized membrane protein YdjX (TVP38/TMEM64 family)